ncbi:MAG: molybdenum cofactor biosynthesis protein B [Nitrospirota bacterium]
MGHKEHKEKSPDSVACLVITVSDTRRKDIDTSGGFIKKQLENSSHKVVDYFIIKDNIDEIKAGIESGLVNPFVNAVILNGGTGISKRDSTYEVVSRIIEKKIDGFGEIFRRLSYKEIGSAAIMSRAIAGVCKGKIVISMPGSESAVRLAMKSLILPELAHMVYEANR